MRASLIMAGVISATSGAATTAVGQGAGIPPHEREVAQVVGRWIERTPSGPAAMPRGSEDAAMIYDPIRDRVIVHGGKDDANLYTNETWAFDSDARVWEKLKTAGPTPPASEDHSTIYDPIGHRLILYGGEHGPTTNKLWSLDLKTLTWRDMTTPDAPRRESHSAVYDSRRKRMIIFGGFDRTQVDLHDVWAMDLDPSSPSFEQWQDLTVAEGRPPGRIDHSAVYDPGKDRLVFHGGWTKARKAVLGDTWAFSFADSQDRKARWSKMEAASGGPSPRRHAVGVHDPEHNVYVMFGGQTGPAFLNDVWAFDLSRDIWLEVSVSDPKPQPRIDHQADYDSRTHSIVVYGGDAGVPHRKLHDVWALTLEQAAGFGSVRPQTQAAIAR